MRNIERLKVSNLVDVLKRKLQPDDHTPQILVIFGSSGGEQLIERLLPPRSTYKYSDLTG